MTRTPRARAARTSGASFSGNPEIAGALCPARP
jgi:hypothetical protein